MPEATPAITPQTEPQPVNEALARHLAESSFIAATYPAPPPELVMKFAIDAAHQKATALFDGLKVLEALGGEDNVQPDANTLKWLTDKFQEEADEILTHLDYAQTALGGFVYGDAGKRYLEAFAAEKPAS